MDPGQNHDQGWQITRHLDRYGNDFMISLGTGHHHVKGRCDSPVKPLGLA